MLQIIDMGYSKLKIPKICKYCGRLFESKTVVTRFCGSTCTNKSGKERRRKEQVEKQKQILLKQLVPKIVEMQTRPYISVREATILFGISKDTVHHLIKAGKTPAHNFGQRPTRVSRKYVFHKLESYSKRITF